MPPATLEEARNQEGRPAQIEALTKRIEAEDIRYVFFQQVSITGRVMGKGVVSSFFPQVAESGYQLVYGATANLFTDRNGNYIGFGPEESELAAIADLDTFAVLPWDERVARVYCDCYDTETGELLDADPRQNLKRVVSEFEEELGLNFVIGIEPEMMWMRRGEAQGEVEGVTKPYCYHIHQFEELRPVLLDVVDYGQRMGLDMSYGDHEDAPGQLELNFRFDRAGPHRGQHHHLPADLRRGGPQARPAGVVHAEAVHRCLRERPSPSLHAGRRRGPQRLPRPGRHLPALRHRAALPRRHARPLRRADVRRQPVGQLVLPDVGLRLLGAGLQELGLAEPHLHRARRRRGTLRVSRRRLVLQPVPDDRGAPARPAWTGSSASPTPAILRRATPTTCSQQGVELERVPESLGAALDALEADEVVREALPGRLYDVFRHYKRDEWERYLAAVTDWEREEYLEVLP